MNSKTYSAELTPPVSRQSTPPAAAGGLTIIDATSSTAGTAASTPAQGKADRNRLPSNAHAAEKSSTLATSAPQRTQPATSAERRATTAHSVSRKTYLPFLPRRLALTRHFLMRQLQPPRRRSGSLISK